MNASNQGNYRRLVAKREHARRNFFRGLKARRWRQWQKWERAMGRTQRCEACLHLPVRLRHDLAGLAGEGTECRFPWTSKDQAPDAVLCWIHAAPRGFCAFCGGYHEREWTFNFKGDGLCDGCRDHLRDCSPAGTFPGPRDIILQVWSRETGRQGATTTTPAAAAVAKNEEQTPARS